jgi:hypothetical protein
VREQSVARAFFYIPFFSGSERHVKSYICGLASTLALMGVLGTVGCSPDNETEANKASSVAKDPGPTNPDAIKVPDKPQPKSQKEFFQNQPDPRAQNPQGSGAKK